MLLDLTARRRPRSRRGCAAPRRPPRARRCSASARLAARASALRARGAPAGARPRATSSSACADARAPRRACAVELGAQPGERGALLLALGREPLGVGGEPQLDLGDELLCWRADSSAIRALVASAVRSRSCAQPASRCSTCACVRVSALRRATPSPRAPAVGERAPPLLGDPALLLLEQRDASRRARGRASARARPRARPPRASTSSRSCACGLGEPAVDVVRAAGARRRGGRDAAATIAHADRPAAATAS